MAPPPRHVACGSLYRETTFQRDGPGGGLDDDVLRARLELRDLDVDHRVARGRPHDPARDLRFLPSDRHGPLLSPPVAAREPYPRALLADRRDDRAKGRGLGL